MTRGLILAVAAVLVDGAARADDKSHQAAAEKLLVAMDTEKSLERSIEASVEQQMKDNPQLAPAKEVMKKFMTKHLGYAALKGDLVKLYADEFSEDELNKLTEFYGTPVGKKMAAKQTVMTQKAGEIGQKRVQQNLPELTKAVEEALNKKK